jgi:hypothetical protein
VKDLESINRKLKRDGLPRFRVVVIKHNKGTKYSYGAYKLKGKDAYYVFSHRLGSNRLITYANERNPVEVCEFITKKKGYKKPEQGLSRVTDSFFKKHGDNL